MSLRGQLHPDPLLLAQHVTQTHISPVPNREVGCPMPACVERLDIRDVLQHTTDARPDQVQWGSTSPEKYPCRIAKAADAATLTFHAPADGAKHTGTHSCS